MPYETVEFNITKLSENKYRDGSKVYIVANLIERARELEPFDLPLIALNASSNIWHPVSCAYHLARKMKRVQQADPNCPIILDESGLVMDGWCRVAKALFEGQETIKAVRFKEAPPCDYVGEEQGTSEKPMIYEINEKHFSVFKEECIKWIKFLGITEWEISFVYETHEDGCKAACYTKHLHKITRLVLNKRQEVCEPITDESVKKSAFHEVCELLLSGITFIALDEEIPHHGRQGLTESETHRVVGRMENSIFNHVELEG